MQDPTEIKNVLLAEDDNDDVLIFKLAIDKLSIGINLRYAEDGDKLFILLKEYLPDIIFLDIHMPCKDGVSCIIELRKNAAYNTIPVIIYTASDFMHHIDTCYSNGANMYLIKADSVAKLAENLKKIFSVDWKNYLYFPPRNEFVIRS